MTVPRILIVSIVVFACASGKRIPSYAGPFTIVIHSTHNVTDEFNSTGKNWSHLYYSSPKPKQSQYVRGFYFSSVEITNAHTVHVRVSVRSNNMWKRNAFVIKMNNACNALLTQSRFITAMFYEPHELRCPLPKVGFREIRNQSFYPEFPRVPVVPYGRYLFTMALFKGEECYGVNVSDGEARPKV